MQGCALCGLRVSGLNELAAAGSPDLQAPVTFTGDRGPLPSNFPGARVNCRRGQWAALSAAEFVHIEAAKTVV